MNELIERLHRIGRNLNIANGNHAERDDMCNTAKAIFDAKDVITDLTAENERLRGALIEAQSLIQLGIDEPETLELIEAALKRNDNG